MCRTCVASVALDARSSVVRRQECALGNLLADLMRKGVDSDVAILNAGAIRGDIILPPGQLRLKDLVTVCPQAEAVMKLSVSGAQLKEALEAGVSLYPTAEGRFPQVRRRSGG